MALRLTLLQADLSSESDVKNLIAAASKTNRLQLINNASLFSYDDSASVGFDAINQHMMVNLAALLCLFDYLPSNASDRDWGGCEYA